MRPLLAITNALADQNRIRILSALAERGELCVCQLQHLLGLAASTTSKHLSILANAGLLEVRRDGRWSYYRLGQDDVPEDALGVVAWACRRASLTKVVARDRETLDRILSSSPEELCPLQPQDAACCSSAPATHVAARSRRATRKRSRVR